MSAALHIALTDLLTELLDGPPGEAAWLLNPHDPGLFRSLEGLSAEAASRPAPAGGASIAAHVDHLVYGFGLLNRWSAGENPFGSADYTASWRRGTVDQAEWRDLLARLRSASDRWRSSLREPREMDQMELNGVIASVAHLAYHLGSIRQIDAGTQGPPATA
jgi:hypothetical protein